MTYMVLPPHGGYRKLLSYQLATIAFDFGLEFANKYIGTRSRTHDQIVQALRSGKQNIVEASMASGTSKKTEIKLVGVARASLEELLVDYEDFLRQNRLKLWEKDDPEARKVRALAYTTDRSHKTYKSYLEDPESAANCLICLIHQANFLLDRQLEALEKDFVEKGGYTENLFKRRLAKKDTTY